jgi:hypothetical protein
MSQSGAASACALEIVPFGRRQAKLGCPGAEAYTTQLTGLGARVAGRSLCNFGTAAVAPALKFCSQAANLEIGDDELTFQI